MRMREGKAVSITLRQPLLPITAPWEAEPSWITHAMELCQTPLTCRMRWKMIMKGQYGGGGIWSDVVVTNLRDSRRETEEIHENSQSG